MPYERWLSRDLTREALIRAEKRRFDKDIQDEYSKKDCTTWFCVVTNELHRGVLRDLGVPDDLLEDVLDELYSSRWYYRNDDEMNEFFKTLIHVKMDLTGMGPISEGDVVPGDMMLTSIEDEVARPFQFYVDLAKADSVPLVVLAGSWT